MSPLGSALTGFVFQPETRPRKSVMKRYPNSITIIFAKNTVMVRVTILLESELFVIIFSLCEVISYLKAKSKQISLCGESFSVEWAN